MESTNIKLQHNFFLLLLLGVGVVMFFILRPFIAILVLAFSLFVIFRPIHRKILRGCKGKSGIAALLTSALIIVIVLIPLIFVGGLLFAEAQNLYLSVINHGGGVSVINKGVQHIEDYIRTFAPEAHIDIASYGESTLGFIISHLDNIFTSFLSVLVGIFLLIISLFYLFKDGKNLKKNFILLSPLRATYDERILNRVTMAVNSVIKGSLLVAVLQGILASIGCALFGLSSPIIWGLCAMFASLIPGIGTSLVMVPAILVLFFSGQHGAAIGLLIWQVCVVGLVDNFVAPHVINRGINIHPLFILLSVLGGVLFFGPIGFLMGPIILALFFALLDIYPMIIQSHVEKDH